MADLIIDGVERTWSGAGDFGEWANGYIQQGKPRFIDFLPGERQTAVGLNFTGVRHGLAVDGRGFVLMGVGCPSVMDCVDSTGLSGHMPRLIGDMACPPGTGIQFSRTSDHGYRAAGKSRLYGGDIVGHFSVASHVNFGAEANEWLFPRWENVIGPAAIWAKDNLYGASSNWTTVQNDLSAALGSVVGLRAVCREPSAKGCLVIDGYDRLDFGGQTNTSSMTFGLCIDTTQGAVIGPRIPNWYARGLTRGLPGAVHYTGSTSNEIISHVLEATELTKSMLHTYVVDGAMQFLHCEWRDHAVLLPDWPAAVFTNCRHWARTTDGAP